MDAYVRTRERFDSQEVAEAYTIKKNETVNIRNHRELDCISRALDGVPPGSRVLDIPSGTGRLIPLLLEKGYEVVEADSSRHMLSAAKRYYSTGETALSVEQMTRVQFVRQEVRNTTFRDGEFSAVICNRLLHHYPTPELRRQTLAELARICSGPLIVSFFSNFAVSALRFHVSNFLKGRKPDDRIPIWFSVFQNDFESCGLYCASIYPVLYGVSPQTYVKLVKKGAQSRCA